MDVKAIKDFVYKKRAEDPQTWFLAGFRNKEIGDIFLRKYNSYYHRLTQDQMKDASSGWVVKKKRKFHHSDGDLHRYVLMFFGYAVENYLKGILIKRGACPVKSGSKGMLCLDGWITKHNLLNYFEKVFVNADISEQVTLLNLQKAVESGKYGVPKNVGQYDSFSANFDQTIFTTRNIFKKIKKEI